MGAAATSAGADDAGAPSTERLLPLLLRPLPLPPSLLLQLICNYSSRSFAVDRASAAAALRRRRRRIQSTHGRDLRNAQRTLVKFLRANARPTRSQSLKCRAKRHSTAPAVFAKGCAVPRLGNQAGLRKVVRNSRPRN